MSRTRKFMLYSSWGVLMIAALSSCASFDTRNLLSGRASQNEPGQLTEAVKANPPDLEGAYEFVSETTTLTKPKASTERLVPPQWIGLWFFQNGYFSQTLMKKGRGFSTYPSSHPAIGYESFAGSYKVEGDKIELRNDLSLHPLNAGRLTTLSYRFEGDLLILVEELHPHIEDTSEGQVITVLRRLR